MSAGDLKGAFEIDDDTLEGGSSEDVDDLIENGIQEVFEYLEDRTKAGGNSYPFTLDKSGSELRITRDSLSLSHYAYLFCLLVSVYRKDHLLPLRVFEGVKSAVPSLFQACGTLAAAGFVSGCSVSFDFPREDGSGFLTSLKRTYGHLGEGVTRHISPPGASPSQKDGGIDVIAWRPFPDGHPGQLYLLGQCASGKEWREKSVEPQIKKFYYWFTSLPASPIVQAIFIPFSADENVKPLYGRSYSEERHGYYLCHTYGLGIIFDRCRIPFYFNKGLELSKKFPETVERAKDAPKIVDWVNTVRAQAES